MPAIKTRLQGALAARRRARTNLTATRSRDSLRRFFKAAHEALAAGDNPKAVDIATRIYLHEDLRGRINAILARRLHDKATERSSPRLDRQARLSER